MVVVAQLVRASVCGNESRGCEPHLPPKIILKKNAYLYERHFFVKGICLERISNIEDFTLKHITRE